MTYKELAKCLEGLTEAQLEGAIFVNVGNYFFAVEDVCTASGDGDYLFKDEIYLYTKNSPLNPKHEID